VSKSKHNGPNCPRKLFADRSRAASGALPDVAKGSTWVTGSPVELCDSRGVQGMGLANFAGSGAGWSVSIFCSAMTPPVGSLTMSDTTVFATL
jgi:hypothetical protein